jgi:hypothetical protein
MGQGTPVALAGDSRHWMCQADAGHLDDVHSHAFAGTDSPGLTDRNTATHEDASADSDLCADGDTTSDRGSAAQHHPDRNSCAHSYPHARSTAYCDDDDGQDVDQVYRRYLRG